MKKKSYVTGPPFKDKSNQSEHNVLPSKSSKMETTTETKHSVMPDDASKDALIIYYFYFFYKKNRRAYQQLASSPSVLPVRPPSLLHRLHGVERGAGRVSARGQESNRTAAQTSQGNKGSEHWAVPCRPSLRCWSTMAARRRGPSRASWTRVASCYPIYAHGEAAALRDSLLRVDDKGWLPWLSPNQAVNPVPVLVAGC